MKLSESDLFTYSGSFQISYNDYLTNYSGILTHYLNEYSDNTELTFIKSHLKVFLDFNIEILQGIKELNVISESQKEYIYFFRNRFSGIEDVEQPNNKDLQYSEIGINQIYVEKITKLLNNRITTNIRILEYLQDRESRIKLNSQPQHAPTEPAPENEQNKVYFKVGLLFAKKEIYKNVVTIEGYKKVNYYFKDEVFDNPNQLSKRLSLSRQYINDSFTGAKTKHNIFNNLKQLNNIIEYCNKNEIIIDVEFLNKYSVLLENRH